MAASPGAVHLPDGRPPFLPHQNELVPPIYPALQASNLTKISTPINGASFFIGLSQLQTLRRLVLLMILFKKEDTPPSFLRPLAFRLSHYTYVQKDIADPNGTPAGWYIPIVTPSRSPKELSLLLHSMDDLSPLLDQPGCLEAVETLHLADGSAWSRGNFLPLEAYAGVARRCARLKDLYLAGQSKSMLAGLETLLADMHVPLRGVGLEFVFTPVPTREALAEDDRVFAKLLRASAALQRLRAVGLLTFWQGHGLLDLEFPALKAQCRSRAVIFEHDAR